MQRAVALAYRTARRLRLLEVDAWRAARGEVMRLRPDLDEAEAGRRATAIIAWASNTHAAWFWSGVARCET
ncbi:hypothetical protein IGS68_35165 (plasmid) [Skermanella sp. TT6]|uniref:Uncharacterized protein n=1 Tax=Skermanella cutis TaxID=2775420 RepID=A0ABX7BNZ2_9PROT|nr:hypothetical protein [Skermanella sp. TT6]QQP94053.1 hypothetical protein IGS68_35165 [Skermanella sp. TT6]